ncbi:MAG: hypothetical protein IJ428_02350 [Clostridia bacterium]|nr:hypothetical protein [Clostridia bacterium]
MKKRIISLLLLTTMLTSLAACGGDSDGDRENTDTAPTSTDTAEVLPAGIEKKNWDAEFTILYPYWGLYENSFFAEENSGEAMNVALFNRQLKVEEYLGVDIINHKVAGIEAVMPAVQEGVMAGDDLYQMVLTHCITNTAAMITSGYLLDLNTVSTINLDGEWWNHVSNKNLSVLGKQYFAISDYMLPDPNAVLFNKTMINDYKLENPYDLVREGKWTIDKMMEMMSAVTKDNGDSVWDVKDTYGFGCPDDWYLASFIYSSGLTLTEKNEDDELIFAMDKERAYTMAEKLNALLSSPDTFIYAFTIDNDPTRIAGESMNVSNGRSLFSLVASSKLDDYRETTIDFGILPYPKLDEDQENYISNDWSGMMCVPSSVQNPEMVGEVIELLSYYTADEVIPAYYDVVLGEKLSRDDDSKEMLSIIFDGIVFDAGMNYFGFTSGVNAFWDIGDRISGSGWGGYASFLAANKSSAEATIKAFNEAVADVE